MVDIERWQIWVDKNFFLLDSLQDGAKMGVVTDLDDYSGMIWMKKDKSSIKVRRSYWIPWERAGIIISFNEVTAKKLLSLNSDKYKVGVWKGLKAEIANGNIKVYSLKDERDTLKRRGYDQFLVDIGKESID